MAEDPFGRKGDQQDPFGGVSGEPRWAPPTSAEPVAPPAAPQGWQPPAPPTPGGGFIPPQGTKQTNGKATAALVLGILGLPFFCPVLCSVPALVLGYRARREITASGGAQGGEGSAKAAIIMGWIGTVVGVLLLIALVVFAVSEGVDTSSGVEPDPSFDLD